eukprot:m.355806 g.355806  ORF g.355806 m.355806 type:complete len:60 (-) comp17343_c0_seq1:348-527(-)
MKMMFSSILYHRLLLHKSQPTQTLLNTNRARTYTGKGTTHACVASLMVSSTFFEDPMLF